MDRSWQNQKWIKMTSNLRRVVGKAHTKSDPFLSTNTGHTKNASFGVQPSYNWPFANHFATVMRFIIPPSLDFLPVPPNLGYDIYV